MADHKFNNGMEHKQREGSRMAFYRDGLSMQLPDFKRNIKMAQIKIAWLIVELLGWPLTVLGIVVNFDNLKSVILFIIALSFLMVRMYYYVVQKKQSVRDKELDLWSKEQDKIDRIAKQNHIKK